MFLGSEEIKRLILKENLVSNYIDLDAQLQPDGFDLTVNKIEEFSSLGCIFKDSKILPTMKAIEPEEWYTIDSKTKRSLWYLEQGVYLAYFNEEIKLPKSISAIHIQRSTFMRCGDLSIVGAWDMGYNGKGCTMIYVGNPYGLMLEKDSRIVKMQFTPVTEGKLYDGNYQKENL